jgi:ElaB/YqjD/DUF883 family membrane-anchored ribosome-binding protein
MATIADNPFPSTTGGLPDDHRPAHDMGRDIPSGTGGPAGNGFASSPMTSSLDGGETSSASTTKHPANDLLGTVVQGAHSAIDRLAEAAAPAVHRLQDGVSSTSGAISERAHHVREMGDEWAETLRVTVRENPLAAVATAVAVGILISKLTQR